MTEGHMTLPVLSVLALAAVIRSAFGFGEAPVAVPLLAPVIPVEVAAPVAVLVSVTDAGLVLVQDWREIRLGSAGRLILSTLFGIPFGLPALTKVAEPVVTRPGWCGQERVGGGYRSCPRPRQGTGSKIDVRAAWFSPP